MTLTTAEMFVDAMNSVRMIRLHALDEQHADEIRRVLCLTDEEITSRYAIGVELVGTEDDTTMYRFVDGSVARVLDTGRWDTWEPAA